MMVPDKEFSRLTSNQFDAYVFWGVNTEGVDLADTKERDRLLENLLAEAFKLRLLHHGSASYFDPSAGAIVIDADIPLEQQILNFKHEVAHLIASKNIFGSTLDAFSDLQDVLCKAYERPVLAAISYLVGDMIEEVFDIDAKQFKEEWKEKGEYAIARYYRQHLSKNRRRVAEVYNDPTFSSFRQIFQRIADRRTALHGSWRVYQEGFATYREVHEINDPVIAELAKQSFGLSQSDWDRLSDAVKEVRTRKLGRLESNRSRVSRTYREGYELFRRLAASDENSIFPACNFACHFPYHACDLVDCSDEHFDRLLNSLILNVSKRLERLADRPTILAKASLEDHTTHRDVLEYILGTAIPDEISETARSFDGWEQTHIRGSRAVSDALELRGVPRGNGCSALPSKDLRFHVEAGGPLASFGIFSSAGALLRSESRPQGEVLIRRLHDLVWMDQVAMLLRQMVPFAIESTGTTVRVSPPEKGPATIAALNHELMAFLQSAPTCRSALLDFSTKHLREDYISAAVALNGPIVLVQARTADEVRKLVPIASILSEVVFFDCGEFSGHRTVSAFPIGDHVASPVLYASGQDDPETGRRSFASLLDTILIMAELFRKREDCEGQPLAEFGVRPFTPDESWTFTPFFRTAEETRNDVGEPCTVAVGITHLRIPDGDSLLDDSRALFNRGTLAYFPCSHSSNFDANADPAFLEFQKVGAILLRAGDRPYDRRTQNVIASFNVPYIEATYEINCRKLAGVWNSFETLRKEIAKLSSKLQHSDISNVTEVPPSTMRTIEREIENAKDILREIAPRHLIRTASVTLGVNSQFGYHEMDACEQKVGYVTLQIQV
jgi:hypothetical protein